MGVDHSKEESFINLWKTPRPVLFAFTTAFIIGIAIFLYFQFTLGGITLILIVTSGAFLGFFYSAPPLRLSYRGMGELVTFICFGPLAVIGAYYVQTQEISSALIFISVPVGLLTVSILYIHHFPQMENDAKYMKRTSVVQMGHVLSIRVFPVLISSPYVIVGVLCALNFLPIGCLCLLFTSPYAMYLSMVLWRSLKRGGSLPSKYNAMALHFCSGVLLSIGPILFK
jgi:1,4-dihydroxy-2-naphthoate octaprenyltransferase